MMVNVQRKNTGLSSEFADLASGIIDGTGVRLPTSGPIANGDFLKRVGGVIVGAAAGGSSIADAMLLKSFFTAYGIMPANTFHEDLFAYPAPDFSNLNGGSLVQSASLQTFNGVGSPANWGYDLLASKSKILAICGMSRQIGPTGTGIFLSNTLAGTPTTPDGYLMWFDAIVPIFQLYKIVAGVLSSLASYSVVAPPNTSTSPSVAIAFYYDDATDKLIAFARFGSECWFPIINITDATFTVFRYVGIRTFGGTPTIYGTPFAIYAE
jgi:hypothetical protein